MATDPKRTLLTTMAASLVLISLDDSTSGKGISPRSFLPTLVVFVGLAFLSDFSPRVAIPFGYLVLAGQTYLRAPRMLRQISAGTKRETPNPPGRKLSPEVLPDVFSLPGQAGSSTGPREGVSLPAGSFSDSDEQRRARCNSLLGIVKARFPNVSSLGTCSCRPVRGGSTPSQHAFCNAIDITRPGYPNSLDPIYSFLKANRASLKISELFFRDADHQNHIHASLSPKMTGTPKCMGGGK